MFQKETHTSIIPSSFSNFVKSSTCKLGGRLVFSGLERNGSPRMPVRFELSCPIVDPKATGAVLLDEEFDGVALRKIKPRPRIGATEIIKNNNKSFYLIP